MPPCQRGSGPAPGAPAGRGPFPLDAFFALAEADQVTCALRWPLATLRRVRERAAELVQVVQGGAALPHPLPLAVQVAIAGRMQHALDRLLAVLRLGADEQLARVGALTLEDLADLLHVYVRECQGQGGPGLPCAVHVLMLARLWPGE
jgi:hypothetical protein